MSRVHVAALPHDALLARYATGAGYTDGYAIDVPRRVALAEYVETFYTGGVFRIERWLLRWLMGRPSTDAQARQVAQADVDEFAAWRVEDRRDDQLLMCDVHGRTRSWFMVSPTAGGTGTRLYFGSAVVPLAGRAGGPPRMGWGFRALLGFHRLYSRVLLSAAARRVAGPGARAHAGPSQDGRARNSWLPVLSLGLLLVAAVPLAWTLYALYGSDSEPAGQQDAFHAIVEGATRDAVVARLGLPTETRPCGESLWWGEDPDYRGPNDGRCKTEERYVYFLVAYGIGYDAAGRVVSKYRYVSE